MNFNFKSVVYSLSILTVVSLTSCNKDDDGSGSSAPGITIIELGESNSHKATIGADLHMEAEVVAEGTIEKIEVDMHPESGSGNDIEAVYTNYAGQKNADFHEHIEIPSTATPGEYHFHLKVVDKNGKTSEVDADIIIEANSANAPVISGLEIGMNDNHKATVGGDLHLDAAITAVGLIDKIEIDLHPESGSGDDIEAVFTNYAGQSDIDFHNHIEIPATATPGEYHFHIKVTDQQGQTTSVDADVEIE